MPLNPTVSLCLPVRDGGAPLEGALASLQAQRHRAFELLVIDDGSVDGSAALAGRVFQGDPRLRLLSPGAVGLVAALNLGLREARAPLVARMDADDLAHPDRLSLQLAALEADPRLDVVGAAIESFRVDAPLGEGFRLFDAWQNRLLSHEEMARERFIDVPLTHPTALFRRDKILALGGYRDMGWAEDYDLWLRAFERGLRFGKLPEVLLRWRDHGARFTRVDPRSAQGPSLRCKAHHLARGPLASAPPLWIWGAGRVGRRLGRALAAEGLSVAGWIDIDPRKIGQRPDGVPVSAPTALPPPGAVSLLAAVGSRGAREAIRGTLLARGWEEGRHWWCAA